MPSWKCAATLSALAMLLQSQIASAQFPKGDEDGDSLLVPGFVVPGGTVSIANAGEGTVSIPLATPPGIHGMAPQLSLTYRSGSGDEGLGTGWGFDLGYPDAVERSTRLGIPKYTDKDVFVFDGQDLAPVGQDSRYRTRIESFQRIEHRLFLHGNSKWVVTEKDGTELEYGSSRNSQSTVAVLPRNASIYKWHLARVTDTFGNSIEFTYDGPFEAKRLTAIAYTCRGANAAGPAQQATLQWQDRPARLTTAAYGRLILKDKRLDRIETYTDGRLLRSYDLVYDGEPESGILLAPETRTWRLALLKETGYGNPGTSELTRRFAYQDMTGWADDAQYLLPPQFDLLLAPVFTSIDPEARLVDVNGDGLLDIVGRVFPTFDAKRPMQVWLHDGTTWAHAPEWVVPYGSFLNPKGIRLLDVNGDGLVDYVHGYDPDWTRAGDESLEVRLNNGHGWDAPNTTYKLPSGFSFVHRRKNQDDEWFTADSGVRTGDANGDGLVDLLWAIQGRGSEVFFNNGRNGWDWDPGWSIPYDFTRVDSSFLVADNGVRAEDMNGDGLVDLARAYQAFSDAPVREVRLNTGSGWGDPGAWTLPDTVLFGSATGSSPTRRDYFDEGGRFTDVDGDGYLDIVFGKANEFSGTDLGHGVFLNNHSNGFVEVDLDLGVPTALRAQLRGAPPLPPGAPAVDAGTRFLDLNGDGLTDILHDHQLLDKVKPPSCFSWIPCRVARIAQGGKSDLLVRYTNPLGGGVAIGYGGESGLGPLPGRMPFVRTVASSMAEDAGLDDPVVTHAYDYRGGTYDAQRREFIGFSKVLETRTDGSQRERDFYMDAGRWGIENSEMLKGADGKYYFAHPQNYVATPVGHGAYETLLDNEMHVYFHQDDQSQWVRRRTEYSYDMYGNATEVREFGFDGALERRTATAFVYNESDWIVSLPSVVQRFEKLSQTPLSSEESHYDGQGYGAPPKQGALTRHLLIDHRLQAHDRPPYAPYQVQKEYTYDEYGNLRTETNGRAFTGEPTKPGFQIAYDEYDRNGYLFPHKITRGDLIQYTTYDKGLGLLQEAIDFNGKRVQYRYDPLGRLEKTAHEPAQVDVDPDVSVEYVLPKVLPATRPPYMRVTEKLDANRQRIRYEYVDGLGRVKARVAGKVQELWTVTDYTRYDDRGRVATVYEPFWSEAADYPRLVPGSRFRTLSYEDDKLARASHFPAGTSTETLYLAGATCRRDEGEDKPKKETPSWTLERTDAFAQLVEVRLDAGEECTGEGKTWSYTYDGLGGLLTAKDPRNLENRYLHDAGGRLRGFSGPDGKEAPWNGYQIWQDFDAQGNLISRRSGIDVALYTYDGLDRRANLSVSRNKGLAPMVDSIWLYDEEKDAFGNAIENGKGRLTTVVGYPSSITSTRSSLSYDERGRVKEQRVSFIRISGSPGSVSIGYEHDREGKTLSTTLRTLSSTWTRTIRYRRNALGQIDRGITYDGTHLTNAKLVTDADHNPAGQMERVVYGNGMEEIFQYDDRSRMERIVGSGPLQVTYGYYPSGKLQSETHQGRPISLSYGYDGLARLTSVSNSAFRPISLSYGYDDSGNLDWVKDGGVVIKDYQYEPNTNRLTGIEIAAGNPMTVEYDLEAHGNIAKLTVGPPANIAIAKRAQPGPSPVPTPAGYYRSFAYDGLGRLRLYDTGQGQGFVAYDGYGRKLRRTKAGGGIETYIRTPTGEVLATYESPTQKWTLYASADGGRQLASVEADGAGEQVRFIHTDRLGSSRALTDGEGKVVWRGDYLPYGESVCANAVPCPEPGGDNFRFTGQELDDVLGIHDYGARYYHQDLGRFVQIDSHLGSPADPRTLNRYGYALNNPTGFVDPTGHFGVSVGFNPLDRMARGLVLHPVISGQPQDRGKKQDKKGSDQGKKDPGGNDPKPRPIYYNPRTGQRIDITIDGKYIFVNKDGSTLPEQTLGQVQDLMGPIERNPAFDFIGAGAGVATSMAKGGETFGRAVAGEAVEALATGAATAAWAPEPSTGWYRLPQPGEPGFQLPREASQMMQRQWLLFR